MSEPVRVDSPDTALSSHVVLTVESQGEPRLRYLRLELDRRELLEATRNHGCGEVASSQHTYLHGRLVS